MHNPIARALLGGLALATSVAGSASAQTTSASTNPPVPPAPVCTSPEHRQFDFWVGWWDVYQTGKDQVVAHSLIENLYMGCGVRENWQPGRPSAGGSLNSYRPEQKLWRQIWIDSGNSWGVFEGKFENGAMRLSGWWENVNGPGTKGFTRTTWTRNPDGSVRQFGEARGDDGKTWTPAFDFTYKPSKAPPPK
jgi:hypothetical protein